LPIGLGRDGQPVFVNFEFVDGTRGGHVSISGVSGIATKTSFATFLLHSIFNCGVLHGEAHNTKALIFSVKGEDLLFLDYTNSRLTPEQRAKYAQLGCRPPRSATCRCSRRRAPAMPVARRTCGAGQGGQPVLLDAVGLLRAGTAVFVFADGEDERSQYTMLIGQVAARLRRDAVRVGDDGAIKVSGVEARNAVHCGRSSSSSA